jgi:hypothetical protein
MLQMISHITVALVVAVAFQMAAWAGGNAPINRLPRTVAAVAFQENVPIDKLPSQVTAAIKNKFPGSELLLAEKDIENGKVIFEVKIRSKGEIFDLDVTPEGKILKIERED